MVVRRAGHACSPPVPPTSFFPPRRSLSALRASTAMTGGVIAAMLVFQPAPAQAQGTNTWIGTDGNWNNTANWSLGTVPYQGDDVVISTFTNNPPAPVFQAFSKSVTINLPLAGIPQGGNVAADTVTFNRGAGNSGLADRKSVV